MTTFDESYQKELLGKMTNRKFMDAVGGLLRADMFDPDLSPVASEILNRWRKGKKVLSKGQLRQMCNRYKIKGVGAAPSGGGDYDFDSKEILSFSKDRILRDLGIRLQVYREQGKHDRAFQDAHEARNEIPSLNSKAPNILKEISSLPKRRNLCPLGLPKMDEWLQGGIAGGDLATIMSVTSGGKTSFLVYVAMTAARQGKKVGYVTLEVPQYEVEGKIRSHLCGKPRPSEKEWVTHARKLNRKGGVIRIWEFPPNSASVDEINRQIPPEMDILFFDYGDFLRSASGASSRSYQDLGDIYSDLKRIGMDRKIPIWTASQVHRAAYDKDVLEVQDVASSLEKMMTADQVITINQKGDEQKSDREGNTLAHLYIAKNRHGSRFQKTTVTVNWALCQFSEWE